MFYIFIFKNYIIFLKNLFLLGTFKYIWKVVLRFILTIIPSIKLQKKKTHILFYYFEFVHWFQSLHGVIFGF